MQTVLIILGVLGFGAVVISAYVFTVAARNYVSEKNHHGEDNESHEKLFVVRTISDRRQNEQETLFPLTLDDGVVVEEERRIAQRRRA